METRRVFSIGDFKHWLSQQKDLQEFFNLTSPIQSEETEAEKLIGRAIVAKVSRRKLVERITAEDGDAVMLIDEFVSDGGTIIGLGKDIQVEVESGTFSIPRFCVRLVKD